MTEFRALVGVPIAVVLLAGACSPVGVAVGTGAEVAITAQEERGLGGAAADLQIRARIFESWFAYDHSWTTALSADVYDGHVMVTGILEDPDDRAEALRRVWAIDGVKQVFNELQDQPRSLIDSGKDTWISTQLKGALAFDGEVYSINYKIATVNGVVYLNGQARTRAELDRVIAQAREIEGVRRIVPHVRISAAR